MEKLVCKIITVLFPLLLCQNCSITMPPSDPVEASPSQDKVPIKEKSISLPTEPAKAKKPARNQRPELEMWELEEAMEPLKA